MTQSAPIMVVPGDDAPGHTESADRQPWWLYCTEVLGHLRLPYETVTPADVAAREHARIAVFPAAARLDENEASAVRRWVADGGVAVCVGAGPLTAAFGVSATGEVSDGHVSVTGGNGWVDPPDVPLRVLGGVRLDVPAPDEAASDGTAVLARWSDDGTTAMLARRHGAGFAVVSGVDLWQTIVRIQQGDPVREDGVPAADGSAAVDDGVLKCDDGIVLSYETDRALPPDGWVPRPDGRAGLEPVPVFHRPHADLWRQAFVQVLFEAAARTGVVLPWLYYWPSGVPAVAHLSVDSDRNVSEEAETTLRLFDEAGVRTTWCHVYPGGYEPEVVRAIAERGHEHALHYNAVGDADIATWGWPQMRAQHAWAQAMTGHEEIVSNKNHYTRWEGWDEFYLWCQALGVQIDESRGPSKQGNVGFPFGTAHLSFPMAGVEDNGSRLDVLVLPLHVQDLAWAAHESVRDVILEQALAHHGVAHFLFHPVHVYRRTYVQDACRDVVALARDHGMPWWTAAQLNAWERLRREVSLSVRAAAAGALDVVVNTPRPVQDAAILLALPDDWAGSPGSARTDAGVEVGHAVVDRHGRRMVELTTDLPAGETLITLTAAGTTVPAGAATGGGYR
ncbi:hypothetical protein G1H11_06730 [Phytoactinopolyspora alkaliphila]|uniref:Polysaccharide deacetylase family protein n=1 Tax=Phytoactinopolyspora alkaliphila TaxID=1783498 RepID=A0A6N9YJ95_9ACTN|nr:hypothetical protein [Phytoactinopolyspora alkaliphila]NED95005.1 hypothetical protein [Phytoactinopolyspora alkaliphila]